MNGFDLILIVIKYCLVDGLNGHTKSKTDSSNGASTTNGNDNLFAEKQEPIIQQIPKLICQSNQSLQRKTCMIVEH
ncbi:unnamed protein product [Rotaria socialis]|uniref:Uncharacterized protein n=1 Tax=Rotaria socialis TaxID=392032 RepID=A0A821EV20_9BILA|nr:unnamed protein product [Rotaria socialis]